MQDKERLEKDFRIWNQPGTWRASPYLPLRRIAGAERIDPAKQWGFLWFRPYLPNSDWAFEVYVGSVGLAVFGAQSVVERFQKLRYESALKLFEEWTVDDNHQPN